MPDEFDGVAVALAHFGADDVDADMLVFEEGVGRAAEKNGAEETARCACPCRR
jgi:hypothetical protein